MFAIKLQWPDFVTNRCDPLFLDEVMEFWEAQAAHEEERKQQEEKDQQKTTRRRKLASTHRQNYGPSVGVDLNGNPD